MPTTNNAYLEFYRGRQLPSIGKIIDVNYLGIGLR